MHIILADHPDPLTSDHPTHPNHLTTLTVTTMTTPTHHPAHFDQPTRPDPEQQFAKFAKKMWTERQFAKKLPGKEFFE